MWFISFLSLTNKYLRFYFADMLTGILAIIFLKHKVESKLL